jgi:hypothetical protein
MVNRSSESVSVRDALRARLEYNEPVLGHLPEVRLYVNALSLLIKHIGFRSPHLTFFRYTAFRSISGTQTRLSCRR